MCVGDLAGCRENGKNTVFPVLELKASLLFMRFIVAHEPRSIESVATGARHSPSYVLSYIAPTLGLSTRRPTSRHHFRRNRPTAQRERPPNLCERTYERRDPESTDRKNTTSLTIYTHGVSRAGKRRGYVFPETKQKTETNQTTYWYIHLRRNSTCQRSPRDTLLPTSYAFGLLHARNKNVQ